MDSHQTHDQPRQAWTGLTTRDGPSTRGGLSGWYDRLARIGEDHGDFERLGRDHSALFIDAGPRLLVTFETVEEVRGKLPGQAPRGIDLARRHGWSLLALLAEGRTWFRDPAVYRHFDRLTDDGFFEDFERVLFTGARDGGYAAAAFSVAAPGARVLALQPQATLDPTVTGWDRRFRQDRRRDFTSRYGYAPDMVEAASRAFVLHDPEEVADAVHAALFRGANVTRLRCQSGGPRLDRMLDAMGILAPLIEDAMDDRLDRLRFARLWRARRDSRSWLRALHARLEDRGRLAYASRVCDHALALDDREALSRRRADLRGRGAPPITLGPEWRIEAAG